MIVRTARYDYTWSGQQRAIAAFLDDQDNVQCFRLVFPGGTLGEEVGSYLWMDGELVGEGSITASQKSELEALLSAPVGP